MYRKQPAFAGLRIFLFSSVCIKRNSGIRPSRNRRTGNAQEQIHLTNLKKVQRQKTSFAPIVTGLATETKATEVSYDSFVSV